MKKILLVEDELPLSEALKSKLTGSGYDVKALYDAKEIVQQVKDYSPNLILMDIMLPGEDGLIATKKIKADNTLKNIPIVMLTNMDDTQLLANSVLLGVVAYLVKGNTSLDSVVSKVKEIIK